jgi:hypothetical protein
LDVLPNTAGIRSDQSLTVQFPEALLDEVITEKLLQVGDLFWPDLDLTARNGARADMQAQ